jgi:hypothetical protein
LGNDIFLNDKLAVQDFIGGIKNPHGGSTIPFLFASDANLNRFSKASNSKATLMGIYHGSLQLPIMIYCITILQVGRIALYLKQ